MEMLAALRSNWTALDKLPQLSIVDIKNSAIFSPFEKLLLLCRRGCDLHDHNKDISIFHMAVWASNIAVIFSYYENDISLCKYWDLYTREPMLYNILITLLPITDNAQLPPWTNGCNAYLLSILTGNLRMTIYLHDKFYKSVDNEGNNDVLIAAKCKHYNILEFLHKSRSNFKQINKSNETLSIIACKTGQDYILTQYKLQYDVISPIIATIHGHLRCLLYYPDSFIVFETLCIAIKYNHMNIITWIINNYPEFTLCINSKGRGVYLIAAKHGSLECILFLEQRDIRHARDNEGNSALMLAASRAECISIVKHLCNNYSINCINNYGQSALDIAGSAGNVDIYTYLYHYDLKHNPPMRKINTKYVKAYCNICCIEDKADFIICKVHIAMHYSCWTKCKVNHCIYCFEKLQ